MARDIGVCPDYMDRAFKSMESRLGWSAKGSIAQRAADKRSRLKAANELLKLQRSRPLKPPGR